MVIINNIFFRAERLKCANAQWPDIYGHYREAKFTQTKHHWWWKANQVFDQLKATRRHDGELPPEAGGQPLLLINFSSQSSLTFFTGMVLFLEEDHYVSEDFLPVLKLIDSERTSKYPNCDIICLGTYLKSYNYNRDHKTVS